MVKTILDIPSSVGNFTGEHRIWSASTLKEVEECPKRFALRRASFPEIWSRTGFPNRISTAPVVFGLQVACHIENSKVTRH